MYLLTVLCVLLALPEFSTGDSGTQSFTALKFNYDESSYISFYPDMSPMTQSFSVCLWIKKLQSGTSPCAFAYNYNEILIGDGGYYNRLFGSYSLDGQLTNKFTTPQGSWYLYCSTWSLASRTFRIYHNGELVGTQTTPSGRTLQTGQTLVLGNYQASPSGNEFGGEMFNLNIYSRELTSSEVASLSEKGLCTPIPESLEDYRRIKWEEILKLSRSGTVWDIDSGCASNVPLLQHLLEKTKEEKGALNLELEETKEELEEKKEELEDIKTELNLTQTRSLQKGNLTKWDVFYFTDYYNKTFTRDLYRQLVGTWDTISSK